MARVHLLLALALAFLLSGASFAAEDADISAGLAIVSSNASCASLNDSQLGQVGDYLMEQMHPGPAHEYVDQMMGGEGSPALEQAHIQMARAIYCGEANTTLSYGAMVGMMPALYRFGGAGFGGGMMGSGMMGYGYMGYGGWWWVLGLLFWLLAFAALVLIVMWLYKQVFRGGGGASASELLRRRYASGELTKKQFDEMRKDIEG